VTPSHPADREYDRTAVLADVACVECGRRTATEGDYCEECCDEVNEALRDAMPPMGWAGR
jgi:predicted amidophosphoribosyltransferase